MEGLRYRPSTPAEHPDRVAARKRERGPSALIARSVLAGVPRLDTFEAVLILAGFNALEELPPREALLTPEDAAALYDELLDRPVTLAGFAPRLVASYLLRETLAGDVELPRAELHQRVERFQRLAVLRPDGYLAWALSGKTQQRVAPVHWREGAFRAGLFELGRFYSGRNGMAFFPVDEHLREVRTLHPLAEVYDDADVISRVLDGAEASFVELGRALGHMVVHPIDSVAGLAQLPEAMALLIASSPAYLERFQLMTRGEQLQALSKLTTTLLATYGAAASTTRTVAATGRGLEAVSLPALALTAKGTLAVERVAVPVGRVVTALSGGPGATLILQRANEAAKGGPPSLPRGPGQWGPARESMSQRAARYQEQISGRPASEAYWVGGLSPKTGGVKFDGFQDRDCSYPHPAVKSAPP